MHQFQISKSLVVIAEIIILIATLISYSYGSPVAQNKRNVQSDVRTRLRRSFPCYLKCLRTKDQRPMVREFVPRLRDIEATEQEYENDLLLRKRDSGSGDTRNSNDKAKVDPSDRNLQPPKPYYRHFTNNNKRIDSVHPHILKELDSNDIGGPESYRYSLRP